MEYRVYDAGRDQAAVRRIWREVGWIEPGNEQHDQGLDYFISCGRALVADVAGEAECMVSTAPGDLRYLDEDLPFSCVTAVTTSHVARKRGLAGRLTAEAVAADAAAGALVSGLGMFEQGYYDRLGFGSGGYGHWLYFDPAHLTVDLKPALPRRITVDDWEEVHANRLGRVRAHGSCNLTPPEFTRAEMIWSKNGFGLGYESGDGGELSHHVWLSPESGEAGPYYVQWLAYRDARQFLELMALIKSLGDQVRLVKITEPPDIQLQDLLRRPFQLRNATRKSKFENTMRAMAYWQMRILDLPACLARTKLPGDELRFNLALSDPIADLLPADAPWRGVAGEYVVTLGPSSEAEPGTDPARATLEASVGAFTRMWLGVRPATGLAVTDELAGPPELLAQLNNVLRLPDPKPDWDF
jgi:predicted acetyltransferase